MDTMGKREAEGGEGGKGGARRWTEEACGRGSQGGAQRRRICLGLGQTKILVADPHGGGGGLEGR